MSRRGPYLPEDVVVAQLGHVLEVEFATAADDRVLAWRRGAVPLYWCDPARALVWFDGTPQTEQPHSIDIDRAAKDFRRFHDREPSRYRVEKWQADGPWERLGAGRRVDYYSTKWGDRASYTHELGRRTVVWRRGPLFLIQGGALRVTKRGIVG